jgi:hypothetical protein
MARKVLAVRGKDTYLVILSTPLEADTLAVVVRNGVSWPPLFAHSILARGYWREWTGSPEEEQRILAAVPDDEGDRFGNT